MMNEPEQRISRGGSVTDININGYTLVCTCDACPEQYDVFKDQRQVGYLRLRHGEFRADVPECGGKTVYETCDCEGDGCFEDEERMKFLTLAVEAIEK